MSMEDYYGTIESSNQHSFMTYTTRSGHEINDQLAKEAFQTLSDPQIESLRSFGKESEVSKGDFLYRSGEVIRL